MSSDSGSAGSTVSIPSLIAIPFIISLAITFLRLYGELQHWSEKYFNRGVGGQGALVGIVWLVPIFGIYFAIRLAHAGLPASSSAKAIGISLLSVVVFFGGSYFLSKPGRNLVTLLIAMVLFIVAAIVESFAWPALFKTLGAYALSIRIVIAILMFFAIRGNWGTHYDIRPPDLPASGTFETWLLIGAAPQLIFWVSFTIVLGGLFGSIAGAFVRPKAGAATQPA